MWASRPRIHFYDAISDIPFDSMALSSMCDERSGER